jgi:hypothetical protein
VLLKRKKSETTFHRYGDIYRSFRPQIQLLRVCYNGISYSAYLAADLSR